jgi:hypothetical protein
MKRHILLFCAVVFCTVPLVSQQEDPVISKIISLGTSENRTMEHLDIITNRFGGRLAGSDAYANAAEWVAYKFRQWGLEVQIQEAGEVPVGFNRGPWFGRMLSEDGFVLHFATPSYTSGTKGVQRGNVLAEPKTRAEFERMKGALKGAWVLITGDNTGFPIDLSAAADEERASIISDNEAASKYNDSIAIINKENPKKRLEPKQLKDAPALFYKEMREAGILGIIQSARLPIQALYDRKNIDSFTWENLPSCPDIKLDENQYKIIAQKVKERQYFLLEFDIRNHFKMGPVKFYNIIGIIRGSEFPDEYVMTGAHLDAYDVATGGVDDGSGVAPNLEAARLLAMSGAKPRRSIMFTIWAAEEFGLVGSRKWVESNMDNLDKISNYFNRDGGPTVPTGVTVPPAMLADFEKVCAPLKNLNPKYPFTVKERQGEPRPRPKTAGGSDHAFFAMYGVPVISFNLEDKLGYNFSYPEIWHTERDMFNKSIKEYEDHTAIVTAIVCYGLANLDKLLSRENLYKD